MSLQVTQLSQSSLHFLPLYTSTLFPSALKPPPPKSPPPALKHPKPFTQPPSLSKQHVLHYVSVSLSHLPLLSACITVRNAVGARIAVRCLLAPSSTCLLTKHGFLNPTDHSPFARLTDTINCDVQTEG
jgi:hypothetical protein